MMPLGSMHPVAHNSHTPAHATVHETTVRETVH